MHKLLFSIITMLLLSGCGGSDVAPAVPKPELAPDLIGQENNLDTWLDNYGLISNFTLMLESEFDDYSKSVGNSSPSTNYQSASASKLVAAVVILDVITQSNLTLDSNVHEYITWPTSGNLSNITLRELLNFTSGLNQYPEVECALSLVSCINKIKTDNNETVPNARFDYGAAHLQVAGAMALSAMHARDTTIDTWSELFADFSQRYDVFQTSKFNIPSLANPRLAGGMTFRADEYMAFLKKLYNKDILDASALQVLRTATAANLPLQNSPAREIGQTWRYGFGAWLEDCTTNNKTCIAKRISSPGAFGAYPFIDFENGYWGILARQGNRYSLPSSYYLINAGRTAFDNWASLSSQ